MRRFRYGRHPAQFAELALPAASDADPPGRRIAVVVHGGYWRSAFDASLGMPLARDLASSGWAAWNVEYRRLGAGGGWPATFIDVLAAMDMIGTWSTNVGSIGARPARIVLIGHSAGGQLAAWAARFRRVPIAGVVSQAGLLDLHAAEELALSHGAVRELMGGPSSELPAEFAAADPSRAIPLDVPVRCIHARADADVPFAQSSEFVRRSTRAGGDARLAEASGDHYTLIDPAHADWRLCVDAAVELAGSAPARE
nr:alpha/beta hydrolase [Spelaeicoccus albus]